MKSLKKNFIGITICLHFSLVMISCANETAGNQDNITSNNAKNPDQSIRADTIVTGLENPWGMVFLPDKRILVTERSGSIRIISNGKLLDTKITGVPAVYQNGQGGLLDIALHPDYAKNGWIYITYSKPGKGGGGTTLARAKLNGNALVDLQEIFVAQPFVNSGMHFGSRIAFDGKGYVFVSTGERGTKPNAQNLNNHLGKIIRLHDDGKVPTDNPFVSTQGAKPEIWSYGHRNVQGLVYDAARQVLWAHEHGPRGGDELNMVKKGKNYGWPLVTHGIDYDGSIISDKKEKEGIEPPVHVWIPSIAPCGMTVVTGDRYPGWKGSILIGALALQHIARVEISNLKSVREEKLLKGLARFRAVSMGPDGYIYALTEGPGLFLKLVPVK
jgi:glucose/arabinose dehydrogenase